MPYLNFTNVSRNYPVTTITLYFPTNTYLELTMYYIVSNILVGSIVLKTKTKSDPVIPANKTAVDAYTTSIFCIVVDFI